MIIFFKVVTSKTFDTHDELFIYIYILCDYYVKGLLPVNLFK